MDVLQASLIRPGSGIECSGETIVLIFRRAILLTGVTLLTLLQSVPLPAADFAHEVLPILKVRCGKCHTGGNKEGGLSMNTRAELLAGGENGPVVISGNSAGSRLIKLLASDDQDVRMPPEGPRVPAGKIAVLKQWIESGLPWEAGVTLGKSGWEPPLKPRVVKLPEPQHGREHPIDRLLDADLARHNTATPQRTSDAAFLRRASLDVIGLLPAPADLRRFVADRTEDKRDRLIDQLLADEIAYADHWLTTWNDLLRNDYTGTGFITKGRSQITTWLYAALRDNKPYDQFVRELIAPGKESAGFIDGIKWRGEVNASQTRDIQFAQNISQVFLGINMKCASCHDSFIDRWTLSEAYNLAAIYADGPLELNRCDKPTGKLATPRWIFPEIGDVDPKATRTVRLKQLAGLITHPENGRFTRTLVNRIWDRLMGRGIVHPVDAMHTRPWNEDLLDYLAVRFARDDYDLRKLIRLIMTSQAYQARTVILKSEPGEDYFYTGPVARRMTAEQLIDSIWQITGTYPDKPLASVDRAEPDEEFKTDEQEQLVRSIASVPVTAKWIWHPGPVLKRTELRRKLMLNSRPTVARMMVTCDNAFKMRVNGHTVAASRNWQQTVYLDIAGHLLKGENLIEVDAEMFGGAAGFICQIVLMEADKQQVVVSDGTWSARKLKGEWQAVVELHPHGAGPWGQVLKPAAAARASQSQSDRPVRASLVQNDFLMRSLGRPHRDQVVTTRPAELTTLQAIDLSNGEILAGYLNRGAARLVAEGKSSDALIEWLCRYALSRDPTSGERAVLSEVAGEGRDPVAIEDVLWLIFMLPEFQIIR